MIKVTLELTTEQIEQIAHKMIEISNATEPKEESKEAFFKVGQVAEILQVSEQTVRKFIKDGLLKPAPLKGVIRISNKEIERYAKT